MHVKSDMFLVCSRFGLLSQFKTELSLENMVIYWYTVPYILAYKSENLGQILALKARGWLIFGQVRQQFFRCKQLQCLSTVLLTTPPHAVQCSKGAGIYYIAAGANYGWRRLCLFQSVDLVVLNFPGHYSYTVHVDVRLLVCTHSYRPTVYRTLPGRLIHGYWILNIFGLKDWDRLIYRWTCTRVYTQVSHSVFKLQLVTLLMSLAAWAGGVCQPNKGDWQPTYLCTVPFVSCVHVSLNPGYSQAIELSRTRWVQNVWRLSHLRPRPHPCTKHSCLILDCFPCWFSSGKYWVCAQHQRICTALWYVAVCDVCCRTALAEAEIEYNNGYCSPSVYVRYRLQRLSDHLANLGNVTCIVAFIVRCSSKLR